MNILGESRGPEPSLILFALMFAVLACNSMTEKYCSIQMLICLAILFIRLLLPNIWHCYSIAYTAKFIHAFCMKFIYRIMQIVRGGKVSRLHDFLVICGKTFAIVQKFETPYS